MCDLDKNLELFENIEKYKNFDLKKLSTFGIGGKANVVFFPHTISELIEVVTKLGESIIIGNGSNVLFSDHGVLTPVVCTKKLQDKIRFEGEFVTVSAGVNISMLCKECAKNNLSGLENLIGIPATVGGALFMNAGAFGSEISESVYSVKVLKNNRIINLNREELCFRYRYSSFQDDKSVILEITFKLQKESSDKILSKMQQYIVWRMDNQPSGKSAGSVFKRASQPAGLLIDKTGLKGFSIGDAVVSKKHANFIINEGNAKSSQVKQLIKFIKDQVYLKFGILLQEEIIYIGE